MKYCSVDKHVSTGMQNVCSMQRWTWLEKLLQHEAIHVHMGTYTYSTWCFQQSGKTL